MANFLDHNGINSRSGWSELQAFLALKLARDIDADADALIAEFTDHAFGPAAPRMRQYLAELEAARKAMTPLPPGVTYKSRNLDDRTFPYLTTINIHRWQQSFGRMLELTTDSPRHRSNIDGLRRELKYLTPDGIFLSAYTGEGTEALLDSLDDHLRHAPALTQVLLPYDQYDLVAQLHKTGAIQKEENLDDGIQLLLHEVPPHLTPRIEPFLTNVQAQTT